MNDKKEFQFGWTHKQSDDYFNVKGDTIDEVIGSMQDLITSAGQPIEKTQEEKDIDEVVEPTRTKVCPVCGSALVRGETKTGKSFEKCSTNKWDRDAQKAVGCSYINWL